VTTLAHETGRRQEARLGPTKMLVGLGQGIATVVERAYRTPKSSERN
jgi:acetyl-CoA acetyltransferase